MTLMRSGLRILMYSRRQGKKTIMEQSTGPSYFHREIYLCNNPSHNLYKVDKVCSMLMMPMICILYILLLFQKDVTMSN